MKRMKKIKNQTITQTPENHNIYIIRCYGKNGSIIKMGYSSKIINRLNSYYHYNPMIELVGTYYRQDAEEFEKRFHKYTPAIALREWYSEDELEYIIKCIKGESPIIEADPLSDFKSAMLEIRNKMQGCSDFNNIDLDLYVFINRAEAKWGCVKQSIKELGFSKMSTLGWSQRAIKKALVVNSNQNNSQKIYKLTELSGLKVLNWYSKAEIKTKLQSVYNQLNMGKAKSTDINKYYVVKEVMKTVKGQRIEGYTLLNKNFKINK